MKKRKWLGAVLFAIAATAHVTAENAFVTINLNDSSKFSYLLANTPKINFTSDSLKVEGAISASFPMQDVDFFNFTESDITSVPALANNEIRVAYTNNHHVRVEGMKAGEQIALYAVSGICISQTNANADGVAEFELPQPAGVYILKAGTQSIKLVKE